MSLPGNLLAVLALGLVGFGLSTSMSLAVVAQTAGASGPVPAVVHPPKFVAPIHGCDTDGEY